MINKEYFPSNSDTFRVEDNKKYSIDLLESEELNNAIQLGHVTLGLIRPNVRNAVNFTCYSDDEARSVILADISSLTVRSSFQIDLDEVAFWELYQGVYERQIEKHPESVYVMANKWYEFQNLMTSGASTVLLLESENNQAVDIWRSQLGHWDIENTDDLTSLRGKFGTRNYNNLLHGSDDSMSALREVDVIARCARRVL